MSAERLEPDDGVVAQAEQGRGTEEQGDRQLGCGQRQADAAEQPVQPRSADRERERDEDRRDRPRIDAPLAPDADREVEQDADDERLRDREQELGDDDVEGPGDGLTHLHEASIRGHRSRHARIRTSHDTRALDRYAFRA